MGDANAMPSEDANIGAAGGTEQIRKAVSPQPLVEPLPAAIDDFDSIINGHVSTFVNMSEDIGGLIAEQVVSHGALNPAMLKSNSVCCFASRIWRSTEVSHHHDKVKEARNPIAGVYGNTEGVAVHDGRCQ